MKTYQKLTKLLLVTIFSILLMGIVFVTIGSSETNTVAPPVSSTKNIIDVQLAGSTSASEMNAFNPDPPGEVVKLVFIHHSCGDNWLDDGNGDLGAALGDNNYYVSDTYYGWGTDSIGSYTDIGHWWLWFRGSDSSTYLSDLYTTTAQNAIYTRPMTDPGGENEVIMFKSCYPNSNLKGNPDDPPTTGDNPLREQPASSPHHTVGNAKGIYNDILEYFQTRQDKLFVVITAPPLLNDTYADNARAFNNWLVNDWLNGYPYHNVAVFDFYDVLTTNGGDADTNDYGLPTGNHHRVVTTTTPITIEHITDGDDDPSPNVLEYPTGGGTNNHPSSAGNQKATGEFVPLLNVYYNCWKHGDCWADASDWISVTTATDVASIYPGETATYTLSVTTSEGFTDPVTLTLQGAPSGAMTSFDPNPVTPPGNSQLSITTTASTVAGTYAMTVTGTAGVLTDTANLTLVVASAAPPSFALSVSPATRIARPDQVVSYTTVVTEVSAGFTDPVALTLQGAPSGAMTSFDPNPVTPPGDSQLYITTTASTVAGIYAMTVTGISGMLTDTANLTLIVVSAAPSFTLSISPTIRIAKPNQVVSYTMFVAGLNGFSQPVSLTVVGLPTDVGAAWSVNPVTPDGSSILTLSIPSSPPFGDHTLHVVGMAETQTVVESVELIIDHPFKGYLPIILK